VKAAVFGWMVLMLSVAADGTEKSTAGVYRIGPGETALQWVTNMPVPVEDSVVLPYMDRYIYLISDIAVPVLGIIPTKNIAAAVARFIKKFAKPDSQAFKQTLGAT